ncbi:MAG: penicillin-binding protein activator [Gammaproteobacteria bacterium]|nr:penicillin-binding protein activator [Gammaproteobacteria bacterium]
MSAMTRHLPRAALLGLVLALAGCTGMPPAATTAPTGGEAQAESLLRSGQPAQAAREYRRLADAASPPRREALLLSTAEAWLEADDAAAARATLEALGGSALPAPLAARRAIVIGGLQLRDGDPEAALASLRGLEETPLDARTESRYHRIRAEALERGGRFADAARERVALDFLLSNPEAILANQRAIWADLNRLSPEQLSAQRTRPAPDTYSGWLELVLVQRLFSSNPAQQARELGNWRARYPDHPAQRHLLAGPEAQPAPTQYPDRLALLLPLSGELAAIGQAVREGFMAAYYSDSRGGDAPQVQVHDTRVGGARAAYEAAVAAGAGMVVGPLTKEALADLVTGGGLTVPILALNRVDVSPPPAGLYQFGLAPEDDAREAARRAWDDGHRRMLVLVPAGEWGERVAQAFVEVWYAAGGSVAETQYYSGDSLADSVKNLLNITESEQRRSQLSGQLGRQLKFQPQRRQDADAVFLAAFPRDARQIRPLLDFYYASDLPVYATSHLYSGNHNPAADQDMDGIHFADLPWIIDPGPEDLALKEDFAALWPDSAERFSRLFALGLDAYTLVPRLQALIRDPALSIPGRTGRLSLAPDGRVHRSLVWAHFEQGVATPDVEPEPESTVSP